MREECDYRNDAHLKMTAKSHIPNFPMTPHARLSVGWLVGWSVGWSVSLTSLPKKAGKLHFQAHVEEIASFFNDISYFLRKNATYAENKATIMFVENLITCKEHLLSIRLNLAPSIVRKCSHPTAIKQTREQIHRIVVKSYFAGDWKVEGCNVQGVH